MNARRFSRRSLLLAACVASVVSIARAEDISAPVTLQAFDMSWRTLEARTPDLFMAGYGSVWIPPTSKADSGGYSVGYDVYDRFDLGSTASPTLYGTETGIRAMVKQLRRAGVSTTADLVWNHNGYSGTGDSASRNAFIAAGAYPGMIISGGASGDGDFHGGFASGDIQGRVAGLIDIAQESNNQFIRNPVVAGDSRNIPAGTVSYGGRLANIPTEANRRFYPSQNASSQTLYDPATGESFTRYDFTANTATTGTPVAENALGYLQRNAQWLVQDIGIDGFRLDAEKHMEPWVLNYLDRAVYNANPRKLLDGSTRSVFSYGENYDGNMANLQRYVRRDINPATPGTVGGNRDALDFPLFFALKSNLSSNGFGNDWRNIVNASFDVNDDGLANNGSQGVSFIQSHDDFAPDLGNVASAYTLLRPGNANVYFNAKEFGSSREFPKDGRGDALGGLYGDTITKLVDIRNTHGRGDMKLRLVEKEVMAYERDRSAVVLLSNRSDSGFDSRTVQTGFAGGTPLIELTGNASNTTIDPNDDLPQLVVVNNDGTINVRIPRNTSSAGNAHGKGYLVYGLSGPQGAMSLSNIDSTLAGGTPTGATNGTTRLADVRVVKADAFNLALNTNAVNLLGYFRDRDADGDNALFSINGGVDVNGNPLDLNGNGHVDFTTPGNVAYGFERFNQSAPGYASPTGNGSFEQTIDTTKLAEGYNYIETRAFRHRDDNGPAIYSSFKDVIYVDRLKPISAVDSFKSFGSGAGDSDVSIKSVDQTASKVNVFLNLPANVTEAQIKAMIAAGQGSTDQIDRDLFKTGFFGIPNGNNVVTVYTQEITGTFNLQRFTGQHALTGRGAGIGDLNFNGTIAANDIAGVNGAFEQVLYSRNASFNPAGDVDANGLVDARDMLQLDAYLRTLSNVAAAASESRNVVRRFVDYTGNGISGSDIDALYNAVGSPVTNWQMDLNVDNAITQLDVDAMVRQALLTEYGDSNLDMKVNFSDLVVLAAHYNQAGTWASGDYTGDDRVNFADLILLAGHYNFGMPIGSSTFQEDFNRVVLAPEPGTLGLLAIGGLTLLRRRRR